MQLLTESDGKLNVSAASGDACDHADSHPINQREFPDEHIEWARRIARSIHRNIPKTFDVEDLEQEAVTAAWKAWIRWDPSKNDTFQGFAYLWVMNAVKMSIRRRNWTWHTDVLGEAHFEGKGGLEPFMKTSENPETQFQAVEEIEQLYASLDRLPPMERDVIRMTFLEKRTMVQVALHLFEVYPGERSQTERTTASMNRVRAIRDRAMARLRTAPNVAADEYDETPRVSIPSDKSSESSVQAPTAPEILTAVEVKELDLPSTASILSPDVCNVALAQDDLSLPLAPPADDQIKRLPLRPPLRVSAPVEDVQTKRTPLRPPLRAIEPAMPAQAPEPSDEPVVEEHGGLWEAMQTVKKLRDFLGDAISVQPAPLIGIPGAEHAILGAILNDHPASTGLRLYLQSRDFVVEKHRLVWEAMRSVEASGETAYLPSVIRALGERGHLETCGGLSFILSLDGPPLASSLADQFSIVRQASRMRALSCDQAEAGTPTQPQAAPPVEDAERLDVAIDQPAPFVAIEEAASEDVERLPLLDTNEVVVGWLDEGEARARIAAGEITIARTDRNDRVLVIRSNRPKLQPGPNMLFRRSQLGVARRERCDGSALGVWTLDRIGSNVAGLFSARYPTVEFAGQKGR